MGGGKDDRVVSVIYIVLPLALLVVIAAVVVFIAAVRRGQFDDLDTPGVRMLQDEAPTRNRKDAENASGSGGHEPEDRNRD